MSLPSHSAFQRVSRTPVTVVTNLPDIHYPSVIRIWLLGNTKDNCIKNCLYAQIMVSGYLIMHEGMQMLKSSIKMYHMQKRTPPINRACLKFFDKIQEWVLHTKWIRNVLINTRQHTVFEVQPKSVSTHDQTCPCVYSFRWRICWAFGVNFYLIFIITRLPLNWECVK